MNDAKTGKKFAYADSLGIPYAAVVGEEEAASGNLTIKNMKTGEQVTVSGEDAGEYLLKLLS